MSPIPSLQGAPAEEKRCSHRKPAGKGCRFSREAHQVWLLCGNSLAESKLGGGASPVAQWLENPPVNAGDAGSVSGLGRPSGEGNGNTFQYSGLENSVDRAACWAAVREVAEWDTTEVTGATEHSKRGDSVKTRLKY